MSSVIGLVAAMPQESRALLRRSAGVKRTRLDKLPIDRFSIASHPCVLVTSGMGLKRARQATLALLDKFDPKLLISFGIAGAVEEDLNIGDVVLSDTFCTLAQGTLTGLTQLAHWPETAQAAMRDLLASHGQRLFSGTVVTTTGSQVVDEKLDHLAHPVLEMETAGIAQAAAQNGIPVLSLRAISDGPCAPIPLSLASVMDEDANLKWNSMLRALLHDPRIIFESGRVLRNTALAAENAAMAVQTALSHWNA